MSPLDTLSTVISINMYLPWRVIQHRSICPCFPGPPCSQTCFANWDIHVLVSIQAECTADLQQTAHTFMVLHAARHSFYDGAALQPDLTQKTCRHDSFACKTALHPPQIWQQQPAEQTTAPDTKQLLGGRSHPESSTTQSGAQQL